MRLDIRNMEGFIDYTPNADDNDYLRQLTPENNDDKSDDLTIVETNIK